MIALVQDTIWSKRGLTTSGIRLSLSDTLGKTMAPMIRSACLDNYVPLAKSVGLDPYAMLTAFGIDHACLSNPDLKISAQAFARLIHSAACESGRPDFHLRLVETRQISVLGALAFVVREQASARKALEVLFLYMGVHSESARLWIRDEAGLATIHIELAGREPALLEQSLEMMTCTIYQMLRQLMPQGWTPRLVSFASAAPADLATYRRIFGHRIEFQAPLSGIVCRSEDLDTLRQTDPVLEAYARQYIDSVHLLPTQTAAEKVEQLAKILMLSGNCTLEQIAHSMGVNVRTVRRRLSIENVSFRGLLDELRKEMVFRYLEAPGWRLSEVAHLLGFSSLSAFSRWFHTQFGRSVTAWRKSSRPSCQLRESPGVCSKLPAESVAPICSALEEPRLQR